MKLVSLLLLLAVSFQCMAKRSILFSNQKEVGSKLRQFISEQGQIRTVDIVVNKIDKTRRELIFEILDNNQLLPHFQMRIVLGRKMPNKIMREMELFGADIRISSEKLSQELMIFNGIHCLQNYNEKCFEDPLAVGVVQSFSTVLGKSNPSKASSIALTRFSRSTAQKTGRLFNALWNNAQKWGRRDYSEILDPNQTLEMQTKDIPKVPPTLQIINSATINIKIMAHQIEDERILQTLENKKRQGGVFVSLVLGGADHPRYKTLKAMGVVKFIKSVSDPNKRVFYEDSIIVDQSKVLVGKNIFVLGKTNRQFRQFYKADTYDNVFSISQFLNQFNLFWRLPKKGQQTQTSALFFTR